MDALSPDTPTTTEASEALLTASQLAERFAVSRNWVYQAVADDVLPHGRLGEDGPIRFIAAGIDAWLDQQRRGWTPGRGTPARAGALTVSGWIIERELRDGVIVFDIGYPRQHPADSGLRSPRAASPQPSGRRYRGRDLAVSWLCVFGDRATVFKLTQETGHPRTPRSPAHQGATINTTGPIAT